MPKHLLEVSPENPVEMKRTLVGRLVSQFSSFPEVEKIFVLASDVGAFSRYFAAFPEVSGRLCVVKHEHVYDWRDTFRQLGSLFGNSPAVVAGGDFVLPDSLIKRAISKAKRGREVTIFIGHNVPGGKRFPRPAAAIWSVNLGAPSWVLEYSPEGWKDFPRLLRRHHKEIGCVLPDAY